MTRLKRLLTTLRSRLLIYAIRRWCNTEMDQWEQFMVATDHGVVYVTLSYETEHPDAFNGKVM